MKHTLSQRTRISPPLNFRLPTLRWITATAILFLLNVSWISVQAQGRQVSGQVTDDANMDIPGVNIVVKGTSTGTTTNTEGRYTINVPNDNTVLVFSFIGFNTEEVTVGNRSIVDVQLLPDIQSLSEVVVVGYGTQRRADITGSIVSVDAQALREVPVANLSQALQGRAAGIDIQSAGTRPGASPQIRIRGARSLSGSNDPLLVVDGIPYDGNINDLNPDDIASVDVLKDASATAIYGSRGANGVIIVTTRRGRVGEPQISYNGYYGVSGPARRYEVFNAEEFRRMRDVSGYGGNAPYLPVEQESINLGRSTDWQDLVYQNGYITNHDLTVSGGTENTQYSIGGGFFDETAVLPGQSFTRYSLRATIDQRIGKRIKVGLNTMNTLGLTGGESSSPMFALLALSPLTIPYDANGQIINQPAAPREDQFNPLLINVEDSWEEQRRRIRTFNSLYGEVDILDGLKYRLNVGLDFRQDRYGLYQGSRTPFRNGQLSTATVDNGEAYNYTIENLLTYDRTIAQRHRLNFTGLYSIQQYESNNSRIVANNIASDYLQFYNLALAGQAPTVPPDNQLYQKWAILSYMGRLNYNFDDRYILTITGRADGSSRLAPGNQWHFYPAIAAGWNISNESFMENVAFLSNLKLRTGYGQTSNTAIDPYRTLGGMARAAYNFGPQGAYGYYLSSVANPDLGWEYTKTINAGIDFGFFNNRITGAVDVYRQHTVDILLNQQLPPTSGVPGSFLKNVGETENRGIEISLSTINIETEDGFNWSTDFNFFLNRNKILALANPGQTRDIGNGWFVGYPMDVIYDLDKIGIWQANEEAEAASFGQRVGQIKVRDISGPDGVPDGRISLDYDRTILGNFQPDWQGGITNRFAFRGFDLSVVAFGRVGGKLISTLHQPQSYLNTLQGRRNGIRVDFWTPDNPTNAYPQPDATQENPLYGSTLGYFDASFLKIRSINFGYTLPESLVNRVGASNVRVYATAQNPFIMFSPYVRAGGVDPEATGAGFQGVGTANIPGRQLTVGANTPPARSIILGVNLRF